SSIDFDVDRCPRLLGDEKKDEVVPGGSVARRIAGSTATDYLQEVGAQAFHEDCKGHTGVVMSLGKGATLAASWKQKINVRSSTEGELVGLDDALPLILWSRYFMEAQGYTIEHNIVNQDNKSTLMLARNGGSCRRSNLRIPKILRCDKKLAEGIIYLERDGP
ncbi:hypothetical protein THAOC_12565, partial [Thalassiosira oceanica]